jgi:hypothetical protein
MQIRTYSQTRKKEWKISHINLNIDYCDFAAGANNPIIAVFVPDVRTALGGVLRPCPFAGKIDVKNYTHEMGKRPVPLAKGIREKVEIKFLSKKMLPVFGLILCNIVV